MSIIFSVTVSETATRYEIKNGNGKVVLTTVSGSQLTASQDMGKVKLTDESGQSAFVTVTDLKGTNGVIHVIGGVVLPK
jgi:uncharacterized surface protein with fasciclin (FAS1) repeats